MNYIDIILGVLLIIAAIRGFVKGFVVELASLLALILGVWGAIHLSHFTAEVLVNNLNFESEHTSIVAFVITFIIILVVVHVLGKVVTKLVEALALGFINQLAGLLFGVFKSAVILSIFLLFFDRINQNGDLISQETIEKSQVYEPLKSVVPTLLPFLNFWDDENLPSNPEKHEGRKMV